MDNLTICYFGTYREEYSRNKIMIKSLEKQGVKIIYCHKRVWNDIDERVDAVKKGWFNLGLLLRFISTYFSLIVKFFTLPEFDILMVGYPGQLDLHVAKILTLFRKKPVVWDVFMSIALISIERNLDKYNKPFIKFLQIIEKKALKLADLLIFDTEEYANWFIKTYNLKKMKYFIIPTGADEEIFSLCENQSKRNIDQFKLIYYGTFIPNHGVPYIIEASKFLTLEKSIKFQFIGEGPELEKCKNLVDKYNLSNVEFIPWQNPNQIKKFIGDADIVLGAFGKTPQSLMTVQNKIYESLAMGKLVVSGDSPTVRNHFINGQEIVLCDRDNPSDFANKIIELRDNKEKRFQIAENGHKKFTSMYSILKIGGILDENLRDLIK